MVDDPKKPFSNSLNHDDETEIGVVPLSELEENEKKDDDEHVSPEVQGEEDIGGSEPAPGVASDVDEMLEKVGIKGDEDGPHEVNVHDQIDEAEEEKVEE